MTKRIIFHIDVNNAFLSWSAILLIQKGYSIDIRKIASVIGGDETKRSGIVLAKSPVAKKYGIVTAETLYSARKKCPNLKVFPPNYQWYYHMSKEFHEYLKQYSPNILKYSIDEAFLDLTGTKYIYTDYIELAYHIKDEIKTKFGFTVNVGIANNMLCAKMASDFEKPDKVHTLFDEEVKNKMWPLSIEDLFMVGKKTSKKLRELDINTIGDLANKDLEFLTKYFKNQAIFLKNSANGLDDTKVQPQESKNQSISISETLPKDVDRIDELKEVLFRQTLELSRQLRAKNKYCNVVAIIFKNNHFENYSRQIKLENSTDKTEIIYNTVIDLLENSWKKDSIRLIGIKLADLCNERKKQISLFDEEIEEKTDTSFQKKIDEINHKFGSNSVVPASMLGKRMSQKRIKED